MKSSSQNMYTTTEVNTLLTHYQKVRVHSENLCHPLKTEDYVVQPIVDVSPPKWHLGHTTWFFEQFVLQSLPHYQIFHTDFAFVFNSYYESVGQRVLRPDRGNMSRPTVEEVYAYRRYVDDQMIRLLTDHQMTSYQNELITLGLHHEQQHQELLLTDIKYILGHNPLFPSYAKINEGDPELEKGFSTLAAGLYPIGYSGEGFCFDNELSPHQVYLNDFSISKNLTTCGEFMEFIRDGGYENFRHWHSEGWEWVNKNKITAPLYWHFFDNDWHQYTLSGLEKVRDELPLAHVSFYEASAYANWKGMRLPTEFEWEAASSLFKWGQRWEWTNSAYLPYPGFRKADGAIGEYNGKFMVNQMVLRGASVATPAGHSRSSYRNFFHPGSQWQYSGIRLAKN